jgi:hypothetical protein
MQPYAALCTPLLAPARPCTPPHVPTSSCTPLNLRFEFRSSEEPGWLEAHMGRELIAMFSQHCGHRAGCPPPASAHACANDPKAPDRARMVGAMRAWCRAHGRE